MNLSIARREKEKEQEVTTCAGKGFHTPQALGFFFKKFNFMLSHLPPDSRNL